MIPRFLNPSALALLTVVPVLLGFLLWRRRVYFRRIRHLGDFNLVQHLVVPEATRRSTSLSWLWLAAVTSLIVALARPVWGINTEVVEIQGVSVVAVLDISNSMEAQDLLPSRLERAKLTLDELFNSLRGNEVGLVLFAGSAFVQFPLTNDMDTARTFLAAADTKNITQQGTVIEDALDTALNLFDEERPLGRIVVLLTDGEDHEGSLETVFARANELGVTIHSLGYGDTEGAPVPVLNDSGEVISYRVDTNGQMVMSRLDEATLQMIASQTNGVYQRASASGAEITNLVRLINQAETGLLDRRAEARNVERFGIFLLIAVIALTFDMILPVLRGRPL